MLRRRRRPRPRRRRPPPAELADVPIVPVTNFRSVADLDAAEGAQGRPGRHEHPLHGARAGRGRGRRDPRPRSTSSARPTLSALVLAADARDPGHGPRQEPQAARVPARRRGRAGGPGARLGRHGAVRRRPGQGPRRLAADAPASRPRPRPTPSIPATTWTLFAGGDILLDRGVYLTLKKKGADFPFDGGTAEITGRCKDCSPLGWDTPYTKRTGNAGAVRDLIEGADIAVANFENPAPEQPALPRLGDQLLRRPQVHRRPRQRRDRLRLARQQPHPRRRRDRPAPDDQQRQEARDRLLGRGQELRRRRARRRSSRRPGRRSRSSATTRSPAATTRPRPGSAAPACRPRRSRRTSPRRAQAGADLVIVYPALGHRVRPDARSPTRRSWPR